MSKQKKIDLDRKIKELYKSEGEFGKTHKGKAKRKSNKRGDYEYGETDKMEKLEEEVDLKDAESDFSKLATEYLDKEEPIGILGRTVAKAMQSVGAAVEELGVKKDQPDIPDEEKEQPDITDEEYKLRQSEERGELDPFDEDDAPYDPEADEAVIGPDYAKKFEPLPPKHEEVGQNEGHAEEVEESEEPDTAQGLMEKQDRTLYAMMSADGTLPDESQLNDEYSLQLDFANTLNCSSNGVNVDPEITEQGSKYLKEIASYMEKLGLDELKIEDSNNKDGSKGMQHGLEIYRKQEKDEASSAIFNFQVYRTTDKAIFGEEKYKSSPLKLENLSSGRNHLENELGRFPGLYEDAMSQFLEIEKKKKAQELGEDEEAEKKKVELPFSEKMSGDENVDMLGKVMHEPEPKFSDVTNTFSDGRKIRARTNAPAFPDDGMPGIVVEIDGRRVTRKELVQFIEEHKAEFVEFFNNEYLAGLERLGKTREGYLQGDKTPVKDYERDESMVKTGKGDYKKGKKTISGVFAKYKGTQWRNVAFKVGDDYVEMSRQRGKDKQWLDRADYKLNGNPIDYTEICKYADKHSGQFETAMDEAFAKDTGRVKDEPER